MRKASSRQTAVFPLGIKDRVKTELPALVALTAIGEPWFSEQHQTDMLAVALVVRELAPAGSLQAQSATELQRLCEQIIRAENKVEIALNLAECLPWLQVQPNFRIERSLQTVAARQLALAAQACPIPASALTRAFYIAPRKIHHQISAVSILDVQPA